MKLKNFEPKSNNRPTYHDGWTQQVNRPRRVDRSIYFMTDISDGWTIATVDISQIDIQTTISKLSHNTNVLTVPKYLTKLISWMLSNKGISNTILDETHGWIVIQNTRYKINKVLNDIKTGPVSIDFKDRLEFESSYDHAKKLRLHYEQNHCS